MSCLWQLTSWVQEIDITDNALDQIKLQITIWLDYDD